MNVKFWKNTKFNVDRDPIYPCPDCNQGQLILKHRCPEHADEHSRELERYGASYGITYVFSGILICSNPTCRKPVAISAERHDFLEDHEDRQDYTPKFFYPNLRLFPLHKSIPRAIKKQIDLSFSHYFNDLSACANKIRTSVEILLNDQGVATGGTLHTRIEKLEDSKPSLAKKLRAIKWIGNDGSHGSEVSKEDVLDAYQLLEFCLDKLYENSEGKLEERAEQINEARRSPR